MQALEMGSLLLPTEIIVPLLNIVHSFHKRMEKLDRRTTATEGNRAKWTVKAVSRLQKWLKLKITFTLNTVTTSYLSSVTVVSTTVIYCSSFVQGSSLWTGSAECKYARLRPFLVSGWGKEAEQYLRARVCVCERLLWYVSAIKLVFYYTCSWLWAVLSY